MEPWGRSLDQIVHQSHALNAVRRDDLTPGDIVYVKTCNSLYRIHIEEQRTVKVSGGWFDRQGHLPARTTIAGCTWGGSAIKADVVAAVGLSIEFGNRVITSPIKSVIHLRCWQQN